MSAKDARDARDVNLGGSVLQCYAAFRHQLTCLVRLQAVTAAPNPEVTRDARELWTRTIEAADSMERRPIEHLPELRQAFLDLAEQARELF